ncbi:MAG: DnaJ domain-containing protein, partial [Deltaproteobacteria bacterium]|nr:DnaJ domain-containing protein [Deltaproteobacteria bacterium]
EPSEPSLFRAPSADGDDQAGIASAFEALALEEPTAPPALDPSQFDQPAAEASAWESVATQGVEPARPAAAQEDSGWMEPPDAPAPAAPADQPAQPGPAPEGSWHAALGEPGDLTGSRSRDQLEFEGEDGEPLSEQDAKERRQRLLRRAFTNLGGFPRPGGEVEGGVVQPPPPPPKPAAPVQPAPAAPPAGGVSSQDVALQKTIESRAATIAKEDHFARLGIPRTAGKDQVKAAYFSLVKTFHPDRLPPALVHLTPKMELIFGAIREANDELQDDARRKAYSDRLTAGVTAGSEKAAAKAATDIEIFQKQGEMALKKKEFGRAAEAFAKAFAVSKNPSDLAQEGWAMYLDPGLKAQMPAIKAKLEQALKLDAKTDRAAYALGVIARVEGDLSKAEKLFKQAVSANSRNAEAATELRLIEMRRKKK